MKTIKVKKGIIITTIFTLLITIISSFLLILSFNYNRIYNLPKINETTLNIKDYNIDDRKVDFLLNGEWDFYYNQWIVTDNDNNLTGKITLPNHWNDCFNIPSSGYASYKLNITNPTVGTYLGIVLNSFRGSFRAFIDNKLVAYSGEVYKDKVGFVSGYMDYMNNYEVTSNKDLELVLEIGYNDFGGFYDTPWLTSNFNKNTQKLSNTIIYIIVFMFGALLTLGIVLIIINKGFKGFYTTFLYELIAFLCLIINQITSKDGSLLFNKMGLIDYRITSFFCYFFLVISSIMLINKFLKKKIFILYFLALYVGLAGFSFTKYNLITISILFISMLFLLFYRIKEEKELPIGTFCLVILLNFIEIFDYLGFIVFGTEGIVSLTMVFILIILVWEIYKKVKELSTNNIEIKKDLSKERTRALASQIEPHFIFNSLSSIQTLFNEDKEIANEALTDFSKLLRKKIEVLKKELVSFEDEVDNIENFVRIYERQKKSNINIIYNLDYIDFKVPAFSIQPYIENALLHSKIDEKEDGEIMISSFKNDDNIIKIEVKDNGCGFDINNLKSSSIGIKNSIERLKILLNADVNIDSKINEGTTITITFKEFEYEENNSL